MRPARSITTIGAVMALAVPAAAGAQQEQQDWRAPDRVAPQPAPVIQAQPQDLRAPDRRDPGQGVPATPAPTAVTSATDGFEWGDAGIGAAGMLGIVGLVGGGVLLTTRRRHGDAIRPSH